MVRVSLFVIASIATFTAACAATPPSPPAAPVTSVAAPVVQEEAPVQAQLATKIPAGEAEKTDAPEDPACASEGTIGKDGKVCLLAPAYAKRMCGGLYPEVALSMFAKGTPFTRVYLAGDVEAWNASGGRSHRARLAFDEEVLVLAKHATGGSGNGGIVMTGMQASFDVLRWDGSCVSVMEGELTSKRPPAPKPAAVPVSRLEEGTRRALLAAPKVKNAHDAFGKACIGQSEKKVCDKAEQKLAQAIADYVRAGGSLPAPARRP